MKNLNSLNPNLNLDKEKLAKMKEKRPNISHVENYFNIYCTISHNLDFTKVLNTFLRTLLIFCFKTDYRNICSYESKI